MSMYSGGGLLRVEARSGVFDASTETVSPSYFDLVSARASAGRFFSESDEAVVVFTEGFRRRVFGDGPGVGEVVKVDGVPATVIGVAADGFTPRRLRTGRPSTRPAVARPGCAGSCWTSARPHTRASN